MSRPLFAVSLALVFTAGTALGDDSYTHVRSPSNGEASHADILATAFGGSFSAMGRNFSNGSITAIRNKDNSRYRYDDQIWDAGNYRTKLIAAENCDDVKFGYVKGNHGGHFREIFNNSDIGAMSSVSIGRDFRWAIKVDGWLWDSVYTSREADNWGKDMMVSYTMFNAGGSKIGSFLFFEDKKHNSDKDFNDVAVLLCLVPAPQAASMGLLGIGGLGVFGGRRRRA